MPIIDRSPITNRSAYPMRRAGDVVVPASSDALVAVNPVPHFTLPSSSGARPDPNFVAHLMAMADQDPQARTLRGAPINDVQAAYRAASPTPSGQRSNLTA